MFKKCMVGLKNVLAFNVENYCPTQCHILARALRAFLVSSKNLCKIE